METFLLVAHIILSFVIVIVILLQSGQGGGMGAGFGGAAAVGQEIFGGRGAATFLGKLTVVLGTAFMVTSMSLAWFSSKPQSVLDLGQGGGTASQAQVHQIIEEGSGPLPNNAQSAPVNLESLGEGGQEIDPEILEQLQQQLNEAGLQPPAGVEEAPESTLESADPVEEAPVEEEAPAEAEEAPAEAEEAPAAEEEAPAEAEEAPAVEESVEEE